MGRIFETRKATMFARWDKMAKAFTRIGKDIIIAVKGGGPNPESNPALRRVIQNARALNMPKDKVEAAIRRASGEDQADFAEVLYEGYAPHGIAILVETATDNPTRTIANVRLAFRKGNGNIGTSGSVAYMFDRKGVFHLKAEGIDAEELELDLIDHGLEELEADTNADGVEQLTIRCSFHDFGKMQAALEERGLETMSAELEFVPQNTVELPEDQIDEVLALVDRLEQDDDVQKVFHNIG